jgi:hypothetical protein
VPEDQRLSWSSGEPSTWLSCKARGETREKKERRSDEAPTSRIDEVRCETPGGKIDDDDDDGEEDEEEEGSS